MTKGSKRLLQLLAAFVAAALGLWGWLGSLTADSGHVEPVREAERKVGLDATAAEILLSVDGDADTSSMPPVSEKRRRVEVASSVSSNGFALRGVVLDHTGDPVSAFRVAAVRRNPTDKSLNRRESFVDIEDGRFELSGLSAGAYSVFATGSVEERYSLFVEVDVPSPEELVLILAEPASLAGVVLDPDGFPVEGATVRVTGRSKDESQTDSAGRFASFELRPGSYRVVAEAEGWVSNDPLEVPLPAGEHRTDLVIRLGLGGRVMGVVLDNEGNADPGVEVGIRSPIRDTDSFLSGVKTDEAGEFVFEGVRQGLHLLVAGDDDRVGGTMRLGKVDVVAGETHHVVLGGAPTRPVRVHGQVLAEGLPLAGGRLTTLAEGEALFKNFNEVDLDDDGRFEVTLGTPGPYVFVVGTGFEVNRFFLDIPPVDIHEVLLELPEGRILGQVVDAEGNSVSTRVGIQRLGAVEILPGESMMRSKDGTFVFKRCAPGTYLVRGPSTDAVEVELGAGATVSVRLVQRAYGGIVGHVVDADGKPVTGAAVFVHDARGRWVWSMSRLASRSNGRFKVDGLGVGVYTLCARDDGLASYESGQAVVREGEFAQIELAVAPGTMVTLSLVDFEGQATHADFRVLDSAGREQIGAFSHIDMARLTRDGFSTARPVVGPLPPGRYRVIATTDGGRRAEGRLILHGETERELELKLH